MKLEEVLAKDQKLIVKFREMHGIDVQESTKAI